MPHARPVERLLLVVERATDAAAIALDQIHTNKFRSTITILGIVIGVAVVVTMSAAIAGIRGVVLAEIEAAGPQNFLVARHDPTRVQVTHSASTPEWLRWPALTPREVERLAELEHVRTATVQLHGTGSVQGPVGSPVDDVLISANSAGWDEFSTGTFVAGHNFLPSDVVASRAVVVVVEPLARSLFGSLDPVDRTVRINGRPFTVAGVFRPQGNIFGEANQKYVVVPYTAGLKHVGVAPDLLHALVVTADGSTQQQAMDQVIGTLRVMRGLGPGEPNNFHIIKQEELLATFNRITGVFFAVMVGLASVALLVGGVGVVAIMMISVTERTREIGVRKALGARRSEILGQFLFEAATLTVAGAAAGMLIGGGATWLIRAATPIPAVMQPWAVAAALVMAALAGVVFGLLPAWRASRMDPVEALRYE
jgi:putative ABC transport system permease protein